MRVKVKAASPRTKFDGFLASASRSGFLMLGHPMKPTFFLAALMSLAFPSCTSTSMRVKASPVAGVDYTAYKTYKWVPLDQEEMKGRSAEDVRLRLAFVEEADTILARRGYTKVDQGKSDLIVYARGVRMTGYRSIGQAPSYENAYRPSRDGVDWLTDSATNSQGYLTEETQRSIRLLISEPASDRIVWRGKAFVGMDDNRAQAMKIEDARSLARKLLDGFPPKK